MFRPGMFRTGLISTQAILTKTLMRQKISATFCCRFLQSDGNSWYIIMCIYTLYSLARLIPQLKIRKFPWAYKNERARERIRSRAMLGLGLKTK